MDEIDPSARPFDAELDDPRPLPPVVDTDPAVRPGAVRITESGRSKLVAFALFVMTACTVFLTALVVLVIFTGTPDGDKINVKLDRQLELLNQQVKNGIDARNANACTAYQNHRAIEDALREIARLNNMASVEPRVLPSDETVLACRSVRIEIVAGTPQISNLSTDSANDTGS